MTTEQVPIKEFTLTNVIRNVSQMNVGINYYTERVNQCNAPWSFGYAQNATHFSVYVHCEKARGEVDWSIKTKILLSLTSSDGKYSSKLVTATYLNSNDNNVYGVREFVPLETLRQKLLINDEVVVEAKVEILEITGIGYPPSLKNFDVDEAVNMADVIILVDDRRFYLSKFVSRNQDIHFSPLYKSLFSDSSVEDVLQLSQMYDSKNVTRLCEDFLIIKSNLSTKKKLQTGSQFDLKELKKRCLESLKTAADVRACLGCGGLANGIKDAEVLNSLVEKSLSFMRGN
ncbi:hypothetical protein CAEBREN_03466 [Caenorhabditis brenneri]|uniref:MATH domain-containing protein n=1 Tax=Caenorhabditis brenneri TaxID=135651 RepID=G0MD34_CAEBE|nr:hypothetical protein CAEBREN_03466 [Caenorhabditis brenneri]